MQKAIIGKGDTTSAKLGPRSNQLLQFDDSNLYSMRVSNKAFVCNNRLPGAHLLSSSLSAHRLGHMVLRGVPE